jgi:glycosyltransferase involved in cell wall biosynthesis
VLVVAWTKTSWRAPDVAEALDGDALLVHPRVPRRMPHPFSTILRYVLSVGITLSALCRRRPSAVIVTNPPIFAPLVCFAWARLARVPVLLDSHPTAFGDKGKGVWGFFAPVHRWLARHASAVLVTTQDRVDEVSSWGATGLVVHEPPAAFPEPAPPAAPEVLFIGVFASDEPVEEVVNAARLLPAVTFRITGDLGRAPDGLVAGSPPNVEYVGYLDQASYRTAVSSSTLVLSLTTAPTSVMRSAYEAVYAGVPLVVTDTPVLAEVFPDAARCDNTGASLAQAISQALADLDSLRARCPGARRRQERRWQDQLAELRRACG